MKISLGLSAESVKAAARRLDEYAEKLEGKSEELCLRLAEAGVDAAVSHVRKDTGELAGGIRFEKSGDKEYLVVSEGEYATFVEFGTGVVGQGTYPGNLPAGWGYDERRTPAAHDSADPTRWYYRDRNGETRSTRGQTANAYMAASAEEMRQAILEIAREVFRT
ncbi:HK97 gp10 family phage protein [Adlercreutzia sp. ZJ242]|uniref:HK97 gp10 family phage protein n=1 Tax=Adlercreutzia sp. ZJ242 TaxID=2709409 RepID=UPI0013EE076D|nr:HK97 gp10 family phage protein [Adlercreutzia sp. ZJ242]